MEQKKSIAEKISSALKKIKSSYTIGVHKHPFAFTILGVFAINLVVLVVSAFIANSVDDTYNGVVDAFARGSIKWLITPNSILNIDNPKTMFLASVVVVLSMVLFSGVVIAMTTNSLKEYFSKKSNAEGKLFCRTTLLFSTGTARCLRWWRIWSTPAKTLPCLFIPPKTRILSSPRLTTS